MEIIQVHTMSINNNERNAQIDFYFFVSDDEDDFAYMAMKPAVIQARKHVMTGGNREMSESKGSLASSSGGPAEVRAALLGGVDRCMRR